MFGRYDKYNYPLVPYKAYPYWRYTGSFINMYLVNVSFFVSMKPISLMRILLKIHILTLSFFGDKNIPKYNNIYLGIFNYFKFI